MSQGAGSANVEQPDSFAFNETNLERAKTIIGKYPTGRQASAVLPLLDLAQRQHDNWLPLAAMNAVAEMLDMPRIRVYEVASFYTMFNKAPVGRNFIQVCTTTPCWLCGSDDVLRAIRDKTGLKPGQTDTGGDFTVIEVECLGACVNAPMVQVNDDYYEDLNYDRTVALVEALRDGRKPEIGSQTGRPGGQASNGPTTLQALQPNGRGSARDEVKAPAQAEKKAAPKKAAGTKKASPAKKTAAAPSSKAAAGDAVDKAKPKRTTAATGKARKTDDGPAKE